MKLRVTAQGTAQTAVKLGRVIEEVADREPVNREVSVQLYGWVMRNFRSEGELAGGWAPLAESTRRWKEKHGYEMILQNTGQLRASFNPFYDRQRAGVGALALARGDRPPNLAEIHQYGTDTIPARPMLPTLQEAMDIGMQVYGSWIDRVVEGHE